MGSDLVSGVLFFQNGGYAHLTVPLGDLCKGSGRMAQRNYMHDGLGFI